jgi:ATP/maltotriose-dependent transcriptional regulator MalT
VLAANGSWDRAQVASDALKAALTKPFPDSLRLEGYLALAEAAARHGDGAQAERTLDDMEAAVKTIPPDFGARAQMIRGVAQQAEGKTDAALATLNQAVRSYSALYGAEHTNTLLCALNQVPPLSSAGKREDARGLLARTAVALRSRFPADAPLLAFLSRPDAVLMRVGHPPAPDAAPLFFN